MASQVEISVLKGGGTGTAFERTVPVLVGRSSAADVHFHEEDVSGRHVLIEASGTGFDVVNLSRRRTVLNGRELQPDERVRLASGDILELGGSVRIRVSFAERSPNAPDDAGTVADGARLPETVAAEAVTMPGMPFEQMVGDTVFRVSTVAQGNGGEKGDETKFLGGGETCIIQTHIASPEEVAEARAALERGRRARRGFFFVVLVLFLALLAGFYVVRQTHRETDWMSLPCNRLTGKTDVRAFLVRNAASNILLRIDYPYSPKMAVQADDARPELEVETVMGRDGDVPYRLRFQAVRRDDELRLSLVDSMWRWMSRRRREESDLTFDAQTIDELEVSFFEDEYAWCCQEATDYGIRFIRQRYQHARSDGKVWCGFVLYFRSGDTAYTLCREIPEAYWKRGCGQLTADPNIGIFRAFAQTYWESPGAGQMPLDWSRAQLLGEIRAELNPERSGIWRKIRRWIDALIVHSWRGTDGERREAFGLLAQLREYERNFYWGKYNAYDAAKANRADKRCRSIRQDCQAVFNEPDDRRYHLINNGEVW